MLSSGLIMGLAFIPLSELLGLPVERVYSLKFGSICITAGLFVGFVSFIITKIVILNKLNDFADNINSITQNILNYKKGHIKSIDECKDCYIELLSKDVIGELTEKYNSLVRVIRSLFWQYERMDEFFSTLNKSLEIEILDTNVGEFILNITPSMGIEIYHARKNGLVVKGYAKGVHTDLTEKKQRSITDIINDNKTVILNGQKVEFVEFGTNSIKPYEIAYLPFSDGNIGGGVVILYLIDSLSRERITLLYRLLNEYALALKSSFAYERMQEMAAFDELTNIYNRRFGLKRLKEEYQRAKRLNSCLCVIMFDIDHFKRVNDTYGHQAGDFILSSFAKILKNSFRDEDVVMRYGGEEFLCAMNNIQTEGAYDKAEKIRKVVEETIFTWKDTNIRITISCGISVFNLESNNKPTDEIIKEADERLYIAKNSGRNRCIYSNPNCLT